MRCYRCREYDHFASECPNTPTDEETDYEDADPASLQMISHDYGPVDSERDYLNLFLPLKSKIGGKVMYVQNKDDICNNCWNLSKDLKKPENFSLNRQAFAGQHGCFLRSEGNCLPCDFHC